MLFQTSQYQSRDLWLPFVSWLVVRILYTKNNIKLSATGNDIGNVRKQIGNSKYSHSMTGLWFIGGGRGGGGLQRH